MTDPQVQQGAVMHRTVLQQPICEERKKVSAQAGFRSTLPGNTNSSLNGQKPEYKAFIFISPSFLYSPFFQNEYGFVEGQFPVRLLPERHGCAHLRLLHHHSLQRPAGPRQRPRLQSHAVRPDPPGPPGPPGLSSVSVKPDTVVHLFRFKLCVITF